MTRLTLLAVGAVAYNLAASVLAWAAGWPPQLGGSPDPDQPYWSFLLLGSTISAPLPPVALLLLGLALVRRHDGWSRLGRLLIGLVGIGFVIGAVGEFVAEHPHVPPTVAYGFGSAVAVMGITLTALAARSGRLGGPTARAAADRRT